MPTHWVLLQMAIRFDPPSQGLCDQCHGIGKRKYSHKCWLWSQMQLEINKVININPSRLQWLSRFYLTEWAKFSNFSSNNRMYVWRSFRIFHRNDCLVYFQISQKCYICYLMSVFNLNSSILLFNFFNLCKSEITQIPFGKPASFHYL